METRKTVTLAELAGVYQGDEGEIRSLLMSGESVEDMPLILLGWADDGRLENCAVALYETPLGVVSVWRMDGGVELMLEGKEELEKEVRELGSCTAWCRNKLISWMKDNDADDVDLLNAGLIEIEDVEATKDDGYADFYIIRRDCIYGGDEWHYAEYADNSNEPITRSFTDAVKRADELNKAEYGDDNVIHLGYNEYGLSKYYVVEV